MRIAVAVPEIREFDIKRNYETILSYVIALHYRRMSPGWCAGDANPKDGH